MNQHPTVQQQITSAALLPIVLLGIVVVLVAGYAIQRITLDLVMQRNAASVQIAAASIGGDLDKYLHLLESAADELAEVPDSQTDPQEAIDRMSGFLEPFGGGVTYLDQTGLAVANTPGQEARAGINYAFREYFQTVTETGQPVFSTVFREHPSGRDVVAIAVPVRHEQRDLGALVGAFFLEEQPWTETLSPLSSPQGTDLFLFDSHGNVIYHPDPTRIGQTVEEASVLHRLAAEGQSQSILHNSLESRQRMVTAYAPIHGTTWGLATNEPWGHLFNPAIPYLLAVFAVVLIGIGFTIIFLFRNIRRVTQPLASLAAETSRVSLGQPFQPLKIEGPQEMQSLIAATNRMVSRLARQQTRLRQYAIQVVRSQEEERKRISRDLHDDTVQELVGLVQRLDLCRRDLIDKPESAAMRMDELNEIAQNTLAGVRRMSHDLRPSILEDLGLSAALQAGVDQLATQLPSASVYYEIVGHEKHLPPELELTAFRIVQEALNNVRKHASAAKRVDLVLFFEEWGIMVNIEDDGPGFRVPSKQSLIRARHLGLAGMVERAQLFGGNLSITSTPGKGTQISLRLNTRVPTGGSTDWNKPSPMQDPLRQ